jgi:hypothetical protein
MWAGTEGGGLVRLNIENQVLDVFDESRGLPGNVIYAILDDADGNIWLTTNGGLVKLNPEDGAVQTFGYIDELVKIRYSYNVALRSSDDKLYFGGTNGFIVFNPQKISAVPEVFPVCISRVQLLNRDVASGRFPVFDSEENTKIVLRYNESSFSFDFSTLSYLSPNQNRYAYMLDGFEPDWNYGGNNRAQYINIPSGHYVFKVKAANNDGVWSKETQISIRVKPPFWRSTLMIFIYVIAASCLLWFLVYSYKRRLEAMNREKI